MTEKSGHAVSPEVLMQAAVREVDKLVKARRRDRIAWIAVSAAIAGLVAVAVILFFQNSTLSSANRRLQADEKAVAVTAYQACLAGNSFRAGEQQLWNSFLHIALANTPDPAQALKILAPFEDQIARVDTPRLCQKP